MGKPSEVNDKSRIQQENEAIILPAAERVFAQKGFKGATMAAIAEDAQLPKANLFYYFRSKQVLYKAVLDRILHEWLKPLDAFHPQADPRQAIVHYVNQKIAFSFEQADASRLFAAELLQGASAIKTVLHERLSPLVCEKAKVLDEWVATGRILPIDSAHFFFSIWSMTQTYADFSVQVEAVLGLDSGADRGRQRATQHVLTCVLRMCGFDD